MAPSVLPHTIVADGKRGIMVFILIVIALLKEDTTREKRRAARNTL